MRIEISDDQYKKLTVAVQSVGYEDLSASISAIVDMPTEDSCGPLSEEELRESIAMIQRGNDEIEAGGIYHLGSSRRTYSEECTSES